MAVRRAAALAVLLVLVSLPVTASVTPSTPEVDPSAFRPFPVPDHRTPLDEVGEDVYEQRPDELLQAVSPVPRDADAGTPDDVRQAGGPGVVVVSPAPTPAHVPKVRPAPTPRPLKPRTKHRATGTPTYYCKAGSSRCTRGYPDGPGRDFYAAAGPSLRVGNWRGRVVLVTANGRSVRVKLIDWCACGGDHFIDLYYDAFKALGFPSHAVVKW